MISARSFAAEIVDGLAQRVLCPNRGLFGTDGPPDEKYTNKQTNKQTKSLSRLELALSLEKLDLACDLLGLLASLRVRFNPDWKT
jgi:hypothetical protein